MSKQVGGIIAWLRNWFDDIYALKGSGGINDLELIETKTGYGITANVYSDGLMAYVTVEGNGSNISTSTTTTLLTLSSSSYMPNVSMEIPVTRTGDTPTIRLSPAGNLLFYPNENTATPQNVEGSFFYPLVSRLGGSVVPSVASISLSATKDILSYYDGESSTITATALDSSSNPVSGQSITFKKGSTVIDTKTTNSSGQCSVTYSSSGVGDVVITAECGNVSQTYNIEDCIYFDAPSLDHSSRYTSASCEGSTGVSSLTYNNGGYYLRNGRNNTCISYAPITLLANSVIELDMQRLNANLGVGICDSNGNVWGIVKTSTNYVNRWTYQNQSWKGGDSHYFTSGVDYSGFLHMRITKTNSNLSVEITNSNNEVLLSKSFTMSSYLENKVIYAGVFGGSSSSDGGYVKNFKIKSNSN